MVAFANLHQANRPAQDRDDVPAAIWRPLFRNVPALASIPPDVRPMRDQVAHLARLMQYLRATAEESALITQAYQLCERTHGYPAIGAALEQVTRLLSEAVVAMHLNVTAIAGARGYPNAGAWAGALVEAHANIPPNKRRFPLVVAVSRAGSPNIEFEDVERGLSLAQVFGVVPREASGEGDSQPFIALAAAARQCCNPHFLEELKQATVRIATQSDSLSAYIDEIARIAQTHDVALPVDWRWFALTRHRTRPRRVNQCNTTEV